MEIYVSTCDKYDHLLPGFAHLFNKYWGPDQEVHVLGFRQPPDLPAKKSFVIPNPKGYLDLLAEKLNTQQLVEAITPMTLVDLCDTVALLKAKLFV